MPTGHCTQEEGELAPCVVEYVPAGHWVQLKEAGALQLPRGQHTPDPEALNVSGAQARHWLEPGAL